jgi:hypothetical protein
VMKKLMRNRSLGHIDFYGLLGVLPNGLMPCDIDMVVERKGKFLFAEWKRDNVNGKAEKVTGGQRIMLQSLARKEGCTVLVIIGNTDDDMVVKNFYRVNVDGRCKKIGAGIDCLKRYIKKWYAYANGES